MHKLSLFIFLFSLNIASYPSFDTAIVLVDMQPEFISLQSEIEFNLIKTQKSLLRWGLKNNMSLLVFEFDGGGDTIAPLQDLIKKFDNRAIVTKYKNGGFHFDPRGVVNPIILLRSWGISRIIISGVNGPYCVQETAQGALNNSFDVYSAGDLVANLEYGLEDFPNCSWWLIEEKRFFSFDRFLDLMKFF